jgi:hypothetical protein
VFSDAFTLFLTFDARFVCHRNSSPDEIFSICLAQENREMYHSDKLIKNEMPGRVQQ